MRYLSCLILMLILCACTEANVANAPAANPANDAPSERAGPPEPAGPTDAELDAPIDAALDHVETEVEEAWKDYYRDSGTRMSKAMWDEAMLACERNAKATRAKLADKVDADRAGYRAFVAKRLDLSADELRRLLTAKLVEGETLVTPAGRFTVE